MTEARSLSENRRQLDDGWNILENIRVSMKVCRIRFGAIWQLVSPLVRMSDGLSGSE
jgi:hypothetical protein